MQTINGIGVSTGRAVGPLRHLVTDFPPPRHEHISGEPEAACEELKAAARAVQQDLAERSAAASGTAKDILSMTAMLAADPTLIKSACAILRAEGLAPAPAVWQAADDVAATFRSAGGALAERAADVLDVRNRIVAQLTGAALPGLPESDAPFILAARDLSPADTAGLDPSHVLGIVTTEGGPTSHTAILARDLGIPAVVAVPEEIESVPDGQMVAVDGSAGAVHLGGFDPAHFASRPRQEFAFSGRGATSDGVHVQLLANVGDAAGARTAALAGAEGVGLMRTEFCFLDAVTEPSISTQSAEYGAVFSAFPGKKVVVRTLDAGADKPLKFLGPADEPNPALGVRGYRTAAVHPQVLRNQLAAIAAAAAQHRADVWVMAPMISTPAEAEEFVAMAADAGLASAGVMVEVPAAALNAGPILARAAFASLGTNDLTQYTLAADRQLGQLAGLADTWDPSVLRLIRATCEAGAAQGRPVGVCGEAAGMPDLAVVLVGLGVDSLSMSPKRLGLVQHVLGTVSMAQARELAERVLACESGAEARALVAAAVPALGQVGVL